MAQVERVSSLKESKRVTREDIITLIDDYITQTSNDNKDRLDTLESAIGDVEDVCDNLTNYVRELRSIVDGVI